MQDLRGEAKTCVPISLCAVTQPYWLPALRDSSVGPCDHRLEGRVPSGPARKRPAYPSTQLVRMGLEAHPGLDPKGEKLGVEHRWEDQYP